MDHSSALSRLICKFPLQQWESWLLPSFRLLIQFQCMCIALSESLTHTPEENDFSARTQWFCAAPFAFSPWSYRLQFFFFKIIRIAHGFDHSLCPRDCSESFICIISYRPRTNSVRRDLLLHLLYRWGSWGIKRMFIIHKLMHVWVVCTIWLLRIMLLWIFVHMCQLDWAKRC